MNNTPVIPSQRSAVVGIEPTPQLIAAWVDEIAGWDWVIRYVRTLARLEAITGELAAAHKGCFNKGCRTCELFRSASAARAALEMCELGDIAVEGDGR